MYYELIDNDEKLKELISVWNKKQRIAVDFEGEFNLHYYGEHLCLIQIYDGKNFYIIDPLSEALSRQALIGFFTSPVKKVWFDCKSDNALVFKLYDVKIENITDIRALGKLIGFEQNLAAMTEYFLNINVQADSKKRHQQADWMKRPLSEELIEYSLNDVKYLFDLEDILLKVIEKENKTKLVAITLANARNVKKSKPGYFKLVNPRTTSKAQMVYLKHFYIAREKLAERFNVPSVQVIDKKKIAQLGLKEAKTLEEIKLIIEPVPQRFQKLLPEALVRELPFIKEELKTLNLK